MVALDDLPGHLIRRLHQISVALFTHRMTETGLDLTPVQFAALVTIGERPGIDQATLAGAIAYDRVTLGGVVDRLVAKGLVGREVSPKDRRARVLELSAEGRAVLDRATPVAEAVQGEIIDGLTEAERRTFTRLLRKTTEAGNRRSRAPLIAPEKEGLPVREPG